MKRFSCIPAGAVFDPRLTPALLRLLLALGLYTDSQGRCHAKKKTLAAVLSTDAKNVQHRLHQLAELGWLKITPRFWSHGGQKDSTYELVLGGGLALTPTPGVGADPPHKEGVLEGVTTPGRAGRENLDMNTLADGAADCYEGVGRRTVGPTQPKAPKKIPPKLNAVTLSTLFVNTARSKQFGHPDPATHAQMRGTFRRHYDQGVSYAVQYQAIQLFFAEWSEDTRAPAGKLYTKQASQWIDAARDDIYVRELPKLQEISVEMWEHVYADLDAWMADNPEATDEERSVMKAALWQQWKQDPKYAVVYV